MLGPSLKCALVDEMVATCISTTGALLVIVACAGRTKFEALVLLETFGVIARVLEGCPFNVENDFDCTISDSRETSSSATARSCFSWDSSA